MVRILVCGRANKNHCDLRRSTQTKITRLLPQEPKLTTPAFLNETSFLYRRVKKTWAVISSLAPSVSRQNLISLKQDLPRGETALTRAYYKHDPARSSGARAAFFRTALIRAYYKPCNVRSSGV